jgi:glycosyltransferase involved in cell wall biosynthesis
MKTEGFKKRIVLLTDCLADLAGGAEKQIYELAKGLDKNKYQVFVVSLDCLGSASRELIEATNSQLHIFRVIRIYGFSGLIQGLRFRRFLRQHQIDILLTYHFSSDIWGTFWGHLAGVKMIISNRRDMGFWRNPLHVTAYRLINPWVKKIVVVSQSIKQMVMEKEGVAGGRIEVIYNGVALPTTILKSKLHRSDLGLGESDIVIMHVANIKAIKGHVPLLKAFVDVVSQFPKVKLILIGRDELNGQIQDLARTLLINDKILFLGKRDDIHDLLLLADVCVLPSLSEGMSNAILEYMAVGKPVIATSVGGNPELVQNDWNGLLVSKENVQELREAMINLVKDPHQRQIMGQNGAFRAKTEFSMDAMISHYDSLFSNIRVLHLISSGGLYGAERVILNLSAKSDAITSFIGALNNDHNSHLEVIEQAKSMGIKNVVFNSRGQVDLRTIGLLRSFIINNDIDILHTHNYKADIIGFWATRFIGKKWVATNHSWLSTDKKSKFYENIDVFVLRFAQKVISVSQEIQRDFLKRNFKKHRLEVIDNGIPIDKFNVPTDIQELRIEMGIRACDCAIVIVGRLSVEKGHAIFLKAARGVIDKTKNVKFIIVGDGPLMKQLKQEVINLDLSDYVIFTGIREDMPLVYALSDILVNSSYIEGLPMTILEAMASRLSIIATNVGAVGEVIKNQSNGILIEAGDEQALRAAILELVYDKEKRRQFAQKSYQDVCQHFSDTRMAQRYRQVYCQIA